MQLALDENSDGTIRKKNQNFPTTSPKSSNISPFQTLWVSSNHHRSTFLEEPELTKKKQLANPYANSCDNSVKSHTQYWINQNLKGVHYLQVVGD